MQSSQPTLEPHSLCYTCWVQIVYSHLPSLLFFILFFFGYTLLLLSSCRHEGVHPELPGVRGLLGVRLPVDVPVVPNFREASFMFYASTYSVPYFCHYCKKNIRIPFNISFYVICAMIYCSFCCIYAWLDPGTYIIARFMSFYKPGITEWYQSRIDCRTKPR